ncbi:hypothetical protein EV127DRAFT_488022 [Xylaria flabelliformis]|nr:hypothetical protein EV127DRAFT_488022 [Xylaria flabelliformis]
MDCDYNDIYITSQDDTSNGLLSKCTDFQGNILIRNATGTLNFTGQAHPSSISVALSTANDLTNVSLPSLPAGAIEFDSSGASYSGSLASLAIVGAKSLETFDAGNLTNLTWLGVGQSGQQDIESFYYGNNITAAIWIETDGCLDLTALEKATLLIVSVASGCDFILSSIKSVHDLILTNLSHPYSLAGLLNARKYDDSDSFLPSFAINGSMLLSSSLLPAGDADGYPNEIAPRVVTVGSDLNITSNTNVNLTFDALTSVGGLSVYNNTNSGFKFDKISTVGSMLLVDNMNTTLLWFPALTRANNIHMRGYIDTSVGPNIFPALQSVPGTVVIEAWNDDFDCSKLVQYHNEHVIHILSCNGTNNGTDNGTNGTNNGTDATSSESNQVLSQGAWGGIGVAIGIVVIGLVGGLIWLYVHFKRQLRGIAETTQQISSMKDATQGHEGMPPIIPTQEVDKAGIIREKPDDPLVELPVRPTELPTSP